MFIEDYVPEVALAFIDGDYNQRFEVLSWYWYEFEAASQEVVDAMECNAEYRPVLELWESGSFEVVNLISLKNLVTDEEREKFVNDFIKSVDKYFQEKCQ